MKNDSPEASPSKAVVEELQRLGQELEALLAHYQERTLAEITQIRDKVSGAEITSGKMRDLRDMLTVLRHAQIKSDKGRRKDLKKIESVIEDLRIVTEHW